MNSYLIISSLLNFSASLLLVTLVSWGRKSNQVWRKFFYFLITVTGWSGAYCLWQISTGEQWAEFFCELLTVFSILIPVALFDFSSELSGIKKPKVLKIGYILAIAVSFLVPMGLIIDGVSAKFGHLFWPNAGVLMPLYLGLFVTYVLLSGWVLIQGKKLHVGRRATDHLFVIYTLLIGFVGGATNFPLWYDIPLQPYGNILVSVYILSMGYGILNRRASGVSSKLYKSLAELLLSFSAALFYLLAITLYRTLIDNSMSGRELAMHAAGAFVLSIVAFWVVPKMKFHTERIIDGVFREGETNALKELQSLPTKLSDLIEEERVMQIAGETIFKNTKVNSIAVLTVQPFVNQLNCSFSAGSIDLESSNFNITTNSPLIERLSARPDCIIYDQVYGDLDDAFYLSLVSLNKQLGISLIVPLFANHRIYGVILLGELEQQEIWSDEFTSALFNIGAQIGLGMQARDFERRASEVDKLVALGTMAAGLAHEIRNPLVSVQTMASLINKGISFDKIPDDFKSVLKRDVQRIESIVEGVALYSQNQKGKAFPIIINDVITESIGITEPSRMKNKVELKTDIKDTENILVLADFDQLVQVFQNLIENSVQAMEDSANRTLAIIGAKKATPKHLDQEWVEISFTDSGEGIPSGILDRIFDPFVTSKDTGSRKEKKGMGLGLAISKRIIESHQGLITVENNNHGGARFSISLKAIGKK